MHGSSQWNDRCGFINLSNQQMSDHSAVLFWGGSGAFREWTQLIILSYWLTSIEFIVSVGWRDFGGPGGGMKREIGCCMEVKKKWRKWAVKKFSQKSFFETKVEFYLSAEWNSRGRRWNINWKNRNFKYGKI